jgi:hypothetical protein
MDRNKINEPQKWRNLLIAHGGADAQNKNKSKKNDGLKFFTHGNK